MPELSSASVRIFWLDKETTLRKLKAAVRRMKATHPEIEQVLLFGSLARDEAVPGSDADLLLILSSASEVFLERIPRYLPEGLPVGVDVFPYTRAEISAMLDEGNLFIRQALADGIPLD
jgi:predicted nucleotidyltransferase